LLKIGVGSAVFGIEEQEQEQGREQEQEQRNYAWPMSCSNGVLYRRRYAVGAIKQAAVCLGMIRIGKVYEKNGPLM